MNKMLVGAVALAVAGAAYMAKVGGLATDEPQVIESKKNVPSLTLKNVASNMVDYSNRSDESTARDKYRNPFETLKFFGVKDNHKVVEILPGSGWYTEILAPKLKAEGMLVAAHYPKVEGDDSYRTRSRENYDTKLRLELDVYGDVVVTDFNLDAEPHEAMMDSDFVLTFRSLHGFENSQSLTKAFGYFNKLLKQGGKLGVVQHEAPEGSDNAVTAKQGYLTQAYVVAAAESAGFKLVDTSNVNKNEKDIIVQENIEGGVWTLPPSLRTDNKERFASIGESNRMTLLFEKI